MIKKKTYVKDPNLKNYLFLPMKEELVFIQNSNQFKKKQSPVICKKKILQVLSYQTKIIIYNNKKKYLKTLDIFNNRISIMRYTKNKKDSIYQNRDY